MLGISLASCLFILSSSIFGMPISGTHTVVGAIIGAGCAALTASEIAWKKLALIIAGWFLAPAVAIMVCFLIFWLVCAFTLKKELSLRDRLLYISLINGVASVIICVLCIQLFQTEENAKDWTAGEITLLPLTLIGGVFLTRLVLTFLAKGTVGHVSVE